MELRLSPPSTVATTVSAANRAAARLSGGLDAATSGAGAVNPAAGGGFGTAFRTALQNVSAAQNRASELQTQFQVGNPNVSLEQTMLAMQKAQVGFQAALHVRNRMMQAYTDVMNMQV